VAIIFVTVLETTISTHKKPLHMMTQIAHALKSASAYILFLIALLLMIRSFVEPQLLLQQFEIAASVVFMLTGLKVFTLAAFSQPGYAAGRETSRARNEEGKDPRRNHIS
jgi:hypothetical protein